MPGIGKSIVGRWAASQGMSEVSDNASPAKIERFLTEHVSKGGQIKVADLIQEVERLSDELASWRDLAEDGAQEIGLLVSYLKERGMLQDALKLFGVPPMKD